MGISKAQVEELNQTNLPTDPPIKIRSQKHREVNTAILDYANNIFTVTISNDSTEIADLRMKNRDVGYVVINDNGKNTGFEKEEATDTLQFTDGTTLITGDKVTIFLQ